ncbi:D-alanyl-D-alanine carboxypeptidase/D-alanyl-D-alanine-endopeptidase [Flavisolibacter sp. BT320]|nr:D-alanyl-D-alanine carboxypeptidase/D-alanyl-D-alanine-endopeptidase [Flavisolibacter longurius]
MRNSFLFLSLFFLLHADAQTVTAKLARAFATFENDPQTKSALSSIYVLDATTGNVVFEKNAQIGVAPASTQKIITAATAYEILGKDFRFETAFGYYGSLKNGVLDGGLYIKPSGDPTLGSWRWDGTSEKAVIDRLFRAFRQKGIRSFSTTIVDERGWESNAIPGGWIWDDIGNYYGAGAASLNWRENQYDLFLKSGTSIGDAVTVVGTKPALYGVSFESKVTSAAKGSGDNSYIYLPVGQNIATVRGTIPVQESHFTISGAMPSALNQFLSTWQDTLAKNGVSGQGKTIPFNKQSTSSLPSGIQYFHTEVSPSMDSIVYWFLRKSINLYGEALAKSMALKKGKTAASEIGGDVIRDYWKSKGIGIDASELNMQDGSGLSPQNRVTTHAQAAVLHYAKKQPWFSGFYEGFPVYNGMKLKSGTIGGAKGFCGYHTSKDGKPYIVAFIVNNYTGSASSIVQKMYKVLDVLK